MAEDIYFSKEKRSNPPSGRSNIQQNNPSQMRYNPQGNMPPQMRSNPQGNMPPQMRSNPQGNIPPQMRSNPQGNMPPQMRSNPQGNIPPQMRSNPQGNMPPQMRSNPQGNMPPQMRSNPQVAAQRGSYVERIDKDQLTSRPGQLSFNNIKTEDGYIKAPDMTKVRKKKSKKKRRLLKGLIISVICLTLVFSTLLTAAAGLSVSWLLDGYTPTEYAENAYTDEAALMHSDKVYNVLLIGTDTLNTSDSSRSDAMILMSVDTKSRQIKLTSFLRDSYVEIPGHGTTKLNAACVYGGPQLVCDTIEYNFGVKIDDYAKVGYDMFIEIIDAVGGVTIPEIDETEAAALAREGFVTEPGENIHLSGYEALLYCRIRKGQSDFYRTERQREVITQVFSELTSANPVKLLTAAKNIASTVECSMEKGQLFSLMLKLLPCLTGGIEQFSVPADGTWYDATKNGQAVLVLDFEENSEMLREFLY